ncbi:MAG: hypothetical protein IPH44_05230 [Myxococcales bacterium]|nr:hypothetical protein [Myxococcales bacterium]MBK7193638.1 hypothetical protein [Myxococcales bacterium]MBP6847870.1 hypothetical protein [Kofleriaceae bacterium]
MIGRAGVVVGVLAAASGAAAAEEWRGRAEGGVEYDSNVQRVEDRQGPQAAPMSRLRAAVDVRGGQPRRARWVLMAAGGARTAMAGGVDTEDATTLALDGAVSRRSSDALALGARATHYEVFPLNAPADAHAFASSGADLSATLTDASAHVATVAVGVRRLAYKPDPDFDWTGATLAVTLEQPLWRGADARAVDGALGYRLEQRDYRGRAYVNACPPGPMPEARCYVPGDRARADLVHVATIKLSYTGQRAASLGYELTVDDSTSFGSSFVRQRLSGSVTTPLPAHVFATLSVVGQLDRYPEPQVVARDIAAQSFDSLDGEARSSAAVRLGRGFGRAWQAELRWSLHASALGDAAGAFRRQLVYAGLTWER